MELCDRINLGPSLLDLDHRWMRRWSEFAMLRHTTRLATICSLHTPCSLPHSGDRDTAGNQLRRAILTISNGPMIDLRQYSRLIGGPKSTYRLARASPPLVVSVAVESRLQTTRIRHYHALAIPGTLRLGQQKSRAEGISPISPSNRKKKNLALECSVKSS